VETDQVIFSIFVCIFFLLFFVLTMITVFKFRLMKEKIFSKTSVGFFLLLIPLLYCVSY